GSLPIHFRGVMTGRVLMAAVRDLSITVGLLVALAGAPALAQEREPAAPLPLNELRTFTEVLERIRTSYVEEVDDATLLENAIRGMLEGLDPHSAYLEPEAFQGLQDTTTGQFGGLGLEVGQEDGFIKVISPIDDTPASRAGIEPGDLIVKIDDHPVKGMSLMDSVDRMCGPAGSTVTRTLVRGAGRRVAVEPGGFLRVIWPLDDTRASRAGIEPGDLIVKIDDHPVKGMSLMDAVDRMRGPAGSKITLTLVRAAGRPFDVELERAVIRVRSVRT